MNESSRRTVRREVTTTRRVRQRVKFDLTPTRAMRLGVRLVISGFKAAARRRPVRLILQSRPTTTQQVESSEEVGETANEVTAEL